MTDTPTYGVGDASYQAAGGIDGQRRLVDDFYDLMEQRPEAAAIARQPCSADFAEYLLTQLHVPAARIVAASRNRHGKRRRSDWLTADGRLLAA